MAANPLRRVVLAGGSGFLGRHISEALLREGAEVILLSRDPGKVRIPPGTQARAWGDLDGALVGADAIINLCGENIAQGRWTPARKEALLNSRLEPTVLLASRSGPREGRPPVLVNASAIGIYGPRDSAPLDESALPGSGFLADLCRRWEAAAEGARAHGTRVVRLRIGIVLDRQAGALPRMALPVKLFSGCPLGDGRQGFSWIHVADLARLFVEAARNPAYEGAVNATAPCPVSNGAFTRLLGRQLHRPILPVPAFLTRAALGALTGEMGRELLLQGAFVQPAKALELGFPFAFGTPERALEDLFQAQPAAKGPR